MFALARLFLFPIQRLQARVTQFHNRCLWELYSTLLYSPHSYCHNHSAPVAVAELALPDPQIVSI